MTELIKVQQVCIGSRFDKHDKVVQYWQKIDAEHHLLGTAFSYQKLKVAHAKAGSVYTFTETETGSTYSKGENAPFYTGQFKDRVLSAEWEAISRKVEIVTSARRKAAKVESELFKGLAPIRSAYSATNAEGKAALIAMVIQEIMKG